MILSRWQLVLTSTPHLHPLPFARGEVSEEVIKRKLQSRKVRRALAAASRLWSRPTKKISCFPAFLIHSAFRSHVRYCTVTTVPTGISEKNLRAVSAGNRM